MGTKMVTYAQQARIPAVAFALLSLASHCAPSNAAPLTSVVHNGFEADAKIHRARRGADSSARVFHGNLEMVVESKSGEVHGDDDDTDVLVASLEIGSLTVNAGETVLVEAAVSSLAYT
jgi:hypothetical protein